MYLERTGCFCSSDLLTMNTVKLTLVAACLKRSSMPYPTLLLQTSLMRSRTVHFTTKRRGTTLIGSFQHHHLLLCSLATTLVNVLLISQFLHGRSPCIAHVEALGYHLPSTELKRNRRLLLHTSDVHPTAVVCSASCVSESADTSTAHLLPAHWVSCSARARLSDLTEQRLNPCACRKREKERKKTVKVSAWTDENTVDVASWR